MLTWNWYTYAKLTKDQLYDLLRLRQDVFIIEQKCFYIDLDYRDQEALHLLGTLDGKLAAYSRLFLPGTLYPDMCSIGRVATTLRGKGIGKELIEETLTYLKKQKVIAPIKISAQLYLEKFYRYYGFETVSEPYDDEGVIHIDMLRKGDHG